MARRTVLYIGADNDIEVVWTKNSDGTAITSASSATFAVKKESDDSTVSNGSGTLTHVASGLWRGTLAQNAALALSTDYYIEAALESSGLTDYRRIPAIAKYRGET